MAIEKIEMKGVRGRFREDCPNRDLRVVLYEVPKELQLAVTFQQEQAGGHYIVREQMDDAPFSGQYLKTLSGETAVSAEAIRADTISYRDQTLRYHKKHKDRMVAGFAGAGNITMNPRFMAYADGRLAYTDIDKAKYFGVPAPAITVGKDGNAAFHASVALGIDKEIGPFVRVGRSDRTGRTACAIQGPCLVRNGHPITPKSLSTMVQDGWFYDLRHVIQFPWIGEPFEVDVGLESLWETQGKVRRLNKERVSKALAGEELAIDLKPYVSRRFPYSKKYDGAVGIDAVQKALESQSYSTTERGEGTRGWYRIDRQAKTLRICYHPGTYNHSILGVTKGNAEIRWLGLAGLGGRVGVTMVDAAKLAAAKGLYNAILIDNGGDVMFNYRGEWVIRSGYDRTRIRGLLLFTAAAGDPELRQDWLPLDPI